MPHKLLVALISGPMYEPLYRSIDAFTERTGVQVEIGFRGTHPDLNAHLLELRQNPYDLISTHTKYAPSQKHLLAPLDDILNQGELADFVPSALDLARLDSHLFGVPRNIDVRLLHYRTDRIDAPPVTWDELLSLAERIQQPPQLYGLVFPGMGPGLFGTFYELVESAGTRLFADDGRVNVENDGGQWAMDFLRTAYERCLVPPELREWHYDEVHFCFRSGRAGMIGDWPACYGLHQDPSISRIAGRFAVCRYPKGPGGASRAYGGCHTFALTPAGAAKPEAVELIRHLIAPDQQMIEAAQGSVPVRASIMRQVQERSSGTDLERWKILQRVVEQDVVIPPKLSAYPKIEEVIWRTVQRGMIGEISIIQTLHHISRQIHAILEGDK